MGKGGHAANSVKESYEGGLCPDCGADIPNEVEDGDACENCGHVFVAEHADD